MSINASDFSITHMTVCDKNFIALLRILAGERKRQQQQHINVKKEFNNEASSSQGITIITFTLLKTWEVPLVSYRGIISTYWAITYEGHCKWRTYDKANILTILHCWQYKTMHRKVLLLIYYCHFPSKMPRLPRQIQMFVLPFKQDTYPILYYKLLWRLPSISVRAYSAACWTELQYMHIQPLPSSPIHSIQEFHLNERDMDYLHI